MTNHACPFCHILLRFRNNPTFIAEFSNSIAFLNFNQSNYLGQSLLILKNHYDHLHLVPIHLQQEVVSEQTRLTDAILKTFGGHRANHQSLGNAVSHVHWHIVPRYPGDPNTGGPPVHTVTYDRLEDDAYRKLATEIRHHLR